MRSTQNTTQAVRIFLRSEGRAADYQVLARLSVCVLVQFSMVLTSSSIDSQGRGWIEKMIGIETAADFYVLLSEKRWFGLRAPI